MPSKAMLPPLKASPRAILPADAVARLNKARNARKCLAGSRTVREESVEDAEWKWIYKEENSESPSQIDTKEGEGSATKRTRRVSKGTGTRRIIGAKLGKAICKISDCVLIHNGSSTTDWVGIISGFEEDEGYDENAESYLDVMKANVWWFSSPKDIHSKTRKRSDFLDVRKDVDLLWLLWLIIVERALYIFRS